MSTAGNRFLTIEQSSQIIGGFCWLERRAFEVLGRWSASEPDDRAALAFSSASLRHGSHSELWTERLPSARGFVVAELVAPPTDRAREVFEAAAAQVDSTTAARLGTWFGSVLPALVDVYSAVLRDLSPVAEAPMRRALTLALDDDRRELEEGHQLLASVGGVDPSEVESAVSSLEGGSCLVAVPLHAS